MQVAPGVHRFGSRLVNWYAVEDAGRLTLVDAGMPGHWKQFLQGVVALGRRMEDVAAIVLTHTHVDHVGFAERARTSGGVRVHVHTGDAERAARKLPPLHLHWRPTSWPFLLEALRTGMLTAPAVQQMESFTDGETLDVPGHPRPVHLPGHTPGSAAIHFPNHGVVCTGDSLVTLDPFTGQRGPRLMLDGVNQDTEQASQSLARLAAVDASLVLPGHGEPWTSGAASAAEAAEQEYRRR